MLITVSWKHCSAGFELTLPVRFVIMNLLEQI